VLNILLGVTPFLVPKHGDRAPIETCKASNHRGVVAKVTVATQLNELLAQCLHILQCMGALRMAGDLDMLPGGQGRSGIGHTNSTKAG
jgi:hypothetical protein